jgi:hypothetical protein
MRWTTVHRSHHETFLLVKYPNLDKRDILVSLQDIWACKAEWRDCLGLQRHAPYSGAGRYQPLNESGWSERQHRCRLFGFLERLKTARDAATLKALRLATRYLPRLRPPESPETRVPRMSERMISASNADRPALLENRIFRLRIARQALFYRLPVIETSSVTAKLRCPHLWW